MQHDWTLWNETQQRQNERLDAAAQARLARSPRPARSSPTPLALRTAGLLRQLADQLESGHPLSA